MATEPPAGETSLKAQTNKNGWPVGGDAGATRRLFIVEATDLNEAMDAPAGIPGGWGTVEIRLGVEISNLPRIKSIKLSISHVLVRHKRRGAASGVGDGQMS